MNGISTQNQVVKLYEALGGTNKNIINADGRGSINKVRGGLSKLLKNTYNYHEKATTKDSQYKQWNGPTNERVELDKIFLYKINI